MSDVAVRVAALLRGLHPSAAPSELVVRVPADAIVALAVLVEAADRCGYAARTELANRLNRREINSEEFVREMRDDQQAMDDALLGVAKALRVKP